MNSALENIIRRQNQAIGDLVEPGIGFRIGRPAFEFTLDSQRDNRWTHVDREHGLKVESQVQVVGETLVISRRLENTSNQLSCEIDRIEPLYLGFQQPSETWHHLYANGGTTEYHYPPSAWQTQEHAHATNEFEWYGSRLTLAIESHAQGRSSNKHFPILMSLLSTAPDSPGLFCGLEWSAHWYIHAERYHERDASALAAGVKVKDLRLAPSETLQLPSVHLGFFEGGGAAGTNTLRRYLYEHVCARYQDKPVIPRVNYNHYYGIGNDINFDKMKRQAKRAAEAGLEIFVIDAAWFHSDYPLGTGNWDKVDTQKFPNGLEPLAEYVRSLGMGFGLWFDIEHAFEGTSVHTAHPEWFVPVDKYDPKNQRYLFNHLNLANHDAQDYVIQTVGGWIKRLDLRWSRWDYNIDPQAFWGKVDPSGKIQFHYMNGLYRVLDTLMAEHPNWMVECCASGGRRIDIGTLKRAHTCWFSDASTDPSVCRFQQARANRFLPGHLLNSGMPTHEGQGDIGLNDTAILSRMLGKLEITGDIAGWSDGLTVRMARWVDKFKALRHLYVQDFYQLLPMPTAIADWDAVQFVNDDRSESAVFVFAGNQGGQKNIPLHGLHSDQTYTVSRDLDGQPRKMHGQELLSQGLPVALSCEQGGLWHIHRQP